MFKLHYPSAISYAQVLSGGPGTSNVAGVEDERATYRTYAKALVSAALLEAYLSSTLIAFAVTVEDHGTFIGIG